MITVGLNAQTTKTTIKDKKCVNKELSIKKDCIKMDKSKSEAVNKSASSCCPEKKNCKQECKNEKTGPQTGTTEKKCPGQKMDCRTTCPNKKGNVK